MHLYEIETALLALFSRIDEGEVSVEDAADTIEGLQLDYDAAVDNAGTRVKELRADAAAIKAEIAALQARLAAKQAQADRYMALILESMRRLDKTKVETPRNCVSIRRNPTKVVIADEAEFCAWAARFAPQFVTRKEEYKPNRETIKTALGRGEAISGARIEQGESLQIK